MEEEENIIMNIQTTGIRADNIAVFSNSSTACSAKSFSYHFLFVCFYTNSKEAVDTPSFLYHVIELCGHLLLTVTERAKDISAL